MPASNPAILRAFDAEKGEEVVYHSLAFTTIVESAPISSGMNTRRPRTSCTACRAARIGCDAATQKPARCSNCVRRGRSCDIGTTAVHKATRRTPSDRTVAMARGSPNESASEESTWHDLYDNSLTDAMSRTSTGSTAQDRYAPDSPGLSNAILTPPSSSFDGDKVACDRLQANMLNDLLWDIYFKVYEMRFSIWLGDSCCPYLELTPQPKASITRLILQLDARQGFDLPDSKTYLPQVPSTLLKGMHTSAADDNLINDALLKAIYAYAVRWLPLRSAFRRVCGQGLSACQSREQDFRSYIWHQAKQAIFHALTRPSYRSILALLLFTLAETPAEDDDPGFVQLCNQAWFSHLKILRSPVKWQVNSLLSSRSAASPTATSTGRDRVVWCLQEDGNKDYEHERNNVFWLCVVSGCTRALLQQLPSAILPGRSGDELVWNLIRQRTVIFDQSFRTLKGSQTPLSSGVADVVLQHATACKTMYFGLINQLCDSLFHHKLSPVEETAQCVIEEVHRFHDVFDHLLTMCARDYIFLSSESQLNYLLLVTHYHLASLTLADILDSQQIVPESLNDPMLSRSRACQTIINTLSLVLTHDRHSANEDSPYGSILLLDASPELMVEVLLRTGNAILVMHHDGETSPHTTQIMLSIVLSALTVLSEISRKACLVTSILCEACAVRQIKIVKDGQRFVLKASADDLTVLAACDKKLAGNFLQEMQVQSTLNIFHLSDMVKRFEEKVLRKGQSMGQSRQDCQQ